MKRIDPLAMVVSGLFVLTAFGAGCGGGGTDETATSTPTRSAGGEREREPDDGMEVEGLLGTISQRAIEDGVQRSLTRISRCFSARYDQLDVLGGSMQMAFRVRTDGSVRWVYLRRSTVGDRATERCIVDVLGAVRFQAPRGGEAEFTTPLELDPPEDVRPPVAWPESRVSPLVSQHAAALLERCGGQGETFHVTAYVAPGGQVMASGAAVDDAESNGQLDCIAEGVQEWRMPDPGSYPAKVSFELR